MVRFLILLTLLMPAFLATGCNGETVKEITLLKKGIPHRVNNKEALSVVGRQSIISAEGVDDVIKEIINPSQLTEFMNQEDGIEIVFEHEQKIKRANNKYPIKFTKIYVPLSGKYYKFGLVFFFGDTEGYGSMPPYINSTGREAFLKSIEIIQ